MAPGDIQGFGMDEAGLRQMAIPTYLVVGAGDTTTPSDDNAGFAAKYIPHVELNVLPGPVGHEIFDNECDRMGRDNYPESCSDAPGVSATPRCSSSMRISMCGENARNDGAIAALLPLPLWERGRV